MIYLSLFIPLIAGLILFVIKQKIHIPHLFLLLLIPIPFIFKGCSVGELTKQNEVLGGQVLSATYYEPWDEYISQTCAREVNCTTDKNGSSSCQTETYDCSYVQDHPEYWEKETSFGDMTTTQAEYNYLKTKFRNSNFIDMNRDYHSIDGDAYTSSWNGDSATYETYFIDHTYENRIQASKSIFNFQDADTIHYPLFKRIRTDGDGDVLSFISTGVNVSSGNQSLNYYNAIFGKSKQLRMIVLVYKNKPLQISIEQEKYWKGGNKNEFIVTIGVDDSMNITWVKPFSWTMKKELFPQVRDDIYSFKKFNDVQIANYLGKNVPRMWQRRQFKEFSYIDVEESESAFWWCYVTMFVLSVGWLILFLAKFEDFVDTRPKYGYFR